MVGPKPISNCVKFCEPIGVLPGSLSGYLIDQCAISQSTVGISSCVTEHFFSKLSLL